MNIFSLGSRDSTPTYGSRVLLITT
jgi:hypothetical protein